MKRSHPLKERWYNMKNRCDKPSNPDYKNYGGRGITVHPDLYEFEYFVKVVEALPGFDLTLELDRIENDGDYTEGNLRWVTSKVNINNSRIVKSSDEELKQALSKFELNGGYLYTALSKLIYEGFSVGPERLLTLGSFKPTSSPLVDVKRVMIERKIYTRCGSYGMKELRSLGFRISQPTFYKLKRDILTGS